jgi:hypothetical protein
MSPSSAKRASGNRNSWRQLPGRSLTIPSKDSRSCVCTERRETFEWLANPTNGCQQLTVHVLDPNSCMVFGVNPFETSDDTWEACRDASLLWTSSNYSTEMKETPRLETNFYVLGLRRERRLLLRATLRLTLRRT